MRIVHNGRYIELANGDEAWYGLAELDCNRLLAYHIEPETYHTSGEPYYHLIAQMLRYEMMDEKVLDHISNEMIPTLMRAQMHLSNPLTDLQWIVSIERVLGCLERGVTFYTVNKILNYDTIERLPPFPSAMYQHLEKFTSLTSLGMDKQMFSFDYLASGNHGLSNSLRILYADESNLTDRYLSFFNNIEYLSASRTYVTLSFLVESHPLAATLTEIHLDGNHFNGSALQRLSNLKTLNIANCDVSLSFMENCRLCDTLEDLNLTGTKQTDHKLQNLSNLKTLNISETKIRLLFPQQVPMHRTLEKLIVMKSIVSSGEIIPFRSLTELRIETTRITLKFLRCVPKHPLCKTLKRLGVSGSFVTDDQLVYLESLQTLWLFGSNCSLSFLQKEHSYIVDCTSESRDRLLREDSGVGQPSRTTPRSMQLEEMRSHRLCDSLEVLHVPYTTVTDDSIKHLTSLVELRKDGTGITLSFMTPEHPLSKTLTKVIG